MALNINEMKKVSVISGGTSGLGLEIAKLLKTSGRNIIVLGRNIEKLEKASEAFSKIDNESIGNVFQCDFGNEIDVKSFGVYIRKNEYSIDYLFNNAGIGLFNPVNEATSDLIDKVFAPNLKGMILLTSEVLKMTSLDEELTIVNIMSTSALYGRAEESIYCAAKWGARGYTEALRTELKGTKRNIIAVYPGGMKTDFWKAPGQNRDTSSFMDPADVAEKIVQAVLVTDKMYVTDITINRKK